MPNLTGRWESICTQFGLTQCISSATHFTEHSESIIDLLLVSNRDNLVTSGVGDPFLHQDIRFHCPIYGLLKFSKQKIKPFKRKIWEYDRGDYNQLRRDIANVTWIDLKSDNIDEYANNITNILITTAEKYIPNKEILIRQSDLPWVTTNIKNNDKKSEKRLYKKARTTNNILHWTNFRNLRNDIIAAIRDSKQEYHNRISDKLKSGQLCSKDWWSTLKHFISENENKTIPPLQHADTIIDGEMEKSNILNNFFRDQTLLLEPDTSAPTIEPYTLRNNLESITFTENEIETLLAKVPLGKASGPDGVNNRILKELKHELATPLTDLFNASIQLGQFPNEWKKANVVPIFKAGNPSLPSNYRPISLLSTISKVLERAVFKHIYNHFRDNNILLRYNLGSSQPTQL